MKVICRKRNVLSLGKMHQWTVCVYKREIINKASMWWKKEGKKQSAIGIKCIHQVQKVHQKKNDDDDDQQKQQNVKRLYEIKIIKWNKKAVYKQKHHQANSRCVFVCVRMRFFFLPKDAMWFPAIIHAVHPTFIHSFIHIPFQYPRSLSMNFMYHFGV